MSRIGRRSFGATVGVAVLGLIASVGTVLLSPAPGSATRAVAETYAVPGDGLLRLTGHGYGHGHGMSQYGAQGAARKGLTVRQILTHYYPGTTYGTLGGQIRVLITADTDDDVRVVPASGLRVRDVSSGASAALPTAGRSAWRLRTVNGATTLEYNDGSWHAYKPGGVALSGDAEFSSTGGTVTLLVGGAGRPYRGALRLASGNTVNVLPLDQYVRGVVPREMPASWLPAAVQAQAVAARTYAAFERAAYLTRSYQTCDTTSCQVYGGVAAEDARSDAAVSATADRVLTYGGAPAFTQFGSSSGGWMSAGSRPYLAAKADPYDDFSGNPVHTWTTTVRRTSVQAAWPAIGTLQRVRVTQRDGNGDWYGRVEQLVLVGSKSSVTVSGNTFRSRFGLRSDWFRFGSGTSAPTPAPTPAPTTTTSPITARWKAIGGAASVVGAATGPEFSRAGGRLRRFEHGRIYYVAAAGAHELYGPVLRAYLKRHGATGKLGFPTTQPRKTSTGVAARFQHGRVLVLTSGKVQVTYS